MLKTCLTCSTTTSIQTKGRWLQERGQWRETWHLSAHLTPISSNFSAVIAPIETAVCRAKLTAPLSSVSWTRKYILQ